MGEIPGAVSMGLRYGFDYISFKPCLLRLEGSGKESLFDPPDPEREERVISGIAQLLEKAGQASEGRIKVLKSVNLQAMLDKKLHELKVQPKVCHSQFFRTVLTPSGVFHCPALRGVPRDASRQGGLQG
jgi:hypothetical protein